jgi:hypothetical protein
VDSVDVIFDADADVDDDMVATDDDDGGDDDEGNDETSRPLRVFGRDKTMSRVPLEMLLICM